MRSLADGMVPFGEISAEARASYENLVGLGFAYTLQTDFNKTDTIPLFEARWREDIPQAVRQEDQRRLSNWLRTRLKNQKIQVREAGS